LKPIVYVQGKRFPFGDDYFYMVTWDGGKYNFVSKEQLTANEMLYVQESTREALEWYSPTD